MPACDQRKVVRRMLVVPPSAAGEGGGRLVGGGGGGGGGGAGPAGIRAEGGRREARCDSGGATTARAARDARGIVRIARRTKRRVVVGRAKGELLQIGFAEHDRAGVEQVLHDWRVAFRAMRREGGRSAGGRKIGRIDVVLERERHPVQRPEPLAALTPLVGGPCRGAQAVRLEADERVER